MGDDRLFDEKDTKDADYVTVAGFLLERFGRLPQAGEAVLECGWRFEAAEIAKNRIASVRIERVKAPEAEDGSSEAATE